MKSKTEEQLRQQFLRLRPSLDERARREWAASEAVAFGPGGIMRVHRASELSRNTIRRGIRELEQRDAEIEAGAAGPLRADTERRVRRPGGGRPKKTDQDPQLVADLESLLESGTRGDPQIPLRWTLKSLRVLAAELLERGHEISHHSVARLLKRLGYSLQANKKTIEGNQHPDRDAQFRYIARQTKARLEAGLVPVLSVDTKKKELVGAYRNGGREYRKVGDPAAGQDPRLHR